MEKNIYAALFGLAGFGLLVNIEWLFLTFALLGVVLLVLERSSGKIQLPFSAEPTMDAAQYQQPVVVQNMSQSLGHDFYMNMVNNQVQAAMNENKGGH